MLESNELNLYWRIYGKLDRQALSSKIVVINEESCFKRSSLYTFECTVLCLKALQVCFPLQTGDALVLLLLMGKHRAKVEEEGKRLL